MQIFFPYLYCYLHGVLSCSREQLWSENKYTSSAITLVSDGEEEEEEGETSASSGDGGKPFSLSFDIDDEFNDDLGNNESGDEAQGVTQKRKKLAIRYVMGDVTHPMDASTDDNIIVHCAGKLVMSWTFNFAVSIFLCHV